MKITEIIGSVADQEYEAARISFMQRIANVFTRSGRVKGPLDFQRSEDAATTTAVPYSSVPASEEDTSTVPSPDALHNAGTTVPRVFGPLPTRHVNPVTSQAQFADLRSEGKMRQNVSNGADHRSR
jgi:hypothetical protein